MANININQVKSIKITLRVNLRRDLNIFTLLWSVKVDDASYEPGAVLETAVRTLRLPRLQRMRAVHLVHHSFWVHHPIPDMEQFIE